MSSETDDLSASAATPGMPSDQAALISLELALTDFARHFQASARRWERMVYPAIFVFGILGVSGFWLIYSLTEDMHDMSLRIDPLMAENLASMAGSVETLTQSVASMDRQILHMANKLDNMDRHISEITGTIADMQQNMAQVSQKLNTLHPLLATIADMNQAMKAMTVNTGVMTRDVNNMSRPMSMLPGFQPW